MLNFFGPPAQRENNALENRGLKWTSPRQASSDTSRAACCVQRFYRARTKA